MGIMWNARNVKTFHPKTNLRHGMQSPETHDERNRKFGMKQEVRR